MMTSTTPFKIELSDSFKRASRLDGRTARARILEILEKHECIELDFMNRHFTPSFVDEVLGILYRDLGKDTFRRRIKVSNIPESFKDLAKLVMFRRLKEGITLKETLAKQK